VGRQFYLESYQIETYVSSSFMLERRATLVKESLRTRIKESSDLLIPIVTVIITIITTFFLKAPSQGGS